MAYVSQQCGCDGCGQRPFPGNLNWSLATPSLEGTQPLNNVTLCTPCAEKPELAEKHGPFLVVEPGLNFDKLIEMIRAGAAAEDRKDERTAAAVMMAAGFVSENPMALMFSPGSFVPVFEAILETLAAPGGASALVQNSAFSSLAFPLRISPVFKGLAVQKGLLTSMAAGTFPGDGKIDFRKAEGALLALHFMLCDAPRDAIKAAADAGGAGWARRALEQHGAASDGLAANALGVLRILLGPKGDSQADTAVPADISEPEATALLEAIVGAMRAHPTNASGVLGQGLCALAMAVRSSRPRQAAALRLGALACLKDAAKAAEQQPLQNQDDAAGMGVGMAVKFMLDGADAETARAVVAGGAAGCVAAALRRFLQAPQGSLCNVFLLSAAEALAASGALVSADPADVRGLLDAALDAQQKGFAMTSGNGQILNGTRTGSINALGRLVDGSAERRRIVLEGKPFEFFAAVFEPNGPKRVLGPDATLKGLAFYMRKLVEGNPDGMKALAVAGAAQWVGEALGGNPAIDVGAATELLVFFLAVSAVEPGSLTDKVPADMAAQAVNVLERHAGDDDPSCAIAALAVLLSLDGAAAVSGEAAAKAAAASVAAIKTHASAPGPKRALACTLSAALLARTVRGDAAKQPGDAARSAGAVGALLEVLNTYAGVGGGAAAPSPSAAAALAYITADSAEALADAQKGSAAALAKKAADTHGGVARGTCLAAEAALARAAGSSPLPGGARSDLEKGERDWRKATLPRVREALVKGEEEKFAEEAMKAGGGGDDGAAAGGDKGPCFCVVQ